MLILRAGQEAFGMSIGRRPPWNKEILRWNDEVKDAIRAKKDVRKKWET